MGATFFYRFLEPQYFTIEKHPKKAFSKHTQHPKTLNSTAFWDVYAVAIEKCICKHKNI